MPYANGVLKPASSVVASRRETTSTRRCAELRASGERTNEDKRCSIAEHHNAMNEKYFVLKECPLTTSGLQRPMPRDSTRCERRATTPIYWDVGCRVLSYRKLRSAMN